MSPPRHIPRLIKLSPLAFLVLAGLLIPLAGSTTVRSQPSDPVVRARQHLSDNAITLGLRPDLGDLQVIALREGLSAEHVRYQQTFAGIPVSGGQVTVSLSKTGGEPPVVISRYVPPVRLSVVAAPLGPDQAQVIVDSLIPLDPANLRSEISVEAVHFPRGKDYVRAWQIIAPTIEPLGSWLFVVAADNGEVLLRHNLLRFDSGQVFDPNPGRTAGGTAPATDCDSAAEETSLSTEYFTRTLLGIQSGQNKLKGEFVDLTAPGILGAYKLAGQADEPSRSYIYPCNDDRFEEAMVYYHVDTTQRKIQSLGFTGSSGIIDRPIAAHAHYFVDCNAFFDPSNRGIHFGDSDVTTGPPFSRCVTTDAAEDADVIVHEYGHAIQHEQVPGWAFGPYPAAEEAAAMGEGFGDFLAGAMFGDPCVGEYVNFGETECGGSPGLRWLQNTKVYPTDFEACPNTGPGNSEEPHCGGEIWGAALWDLVEALGDNQAARDLVLQLVLDAHFYLDPTSTFAEAAAAIRQADNILYGGAHVATIDSSFAARGISTGGPVDDFLSAFLRIRHTFRGDLDTQIQVGDPTSPDCTINLTDPSSNSSDDITAYLNLTSSSCAPLLPPTTTRPWHLEVQDFGPQDVGTIENFEISLLGGERCLAINTPVAIPDAISSSVPGSKVYATVDCTLKSVPPPSPDSDGDGFSNAHEAYMGTLYNVACATTATANDENPDPRPPDFNDDQRVNSLDAFQLALHFGSALGDAAYSNRLDLNADGSINTFDVFQFAAVFNTHCSLS